jgi:effector-binding domain-containing protein
MTYDVQVRMAPALPIAAVRGRARYDNLSARIRELFDEFYSAPPAGPRGLNIVFYHGVPGEDLLRTPEGMLIDCGVQMSAPFKPTGKIIASATPSGTVATLAHFGPYEQLGGAHKALHEWSKENGRAFAGPSWEVYGHWHDVPEQRRTDVFYLLAG